MSGLQLKPALIALPQGRDPAWAAAAAVLLREQAAGLADADLREWAHAAAAGGELCEVLGFAFHHSPFLARSALGDLAFLRDLLAQGPDTCFTRLQARMKDEHARLRDEDLLMRELRITRRRVALLTAIADIAGHWPLDRVTQALSDFADGALSATLSHLLRAAAETGEVALADPHFPEDQCGLVALAMGKHGGRELNYSSDIDLIVLYEPALIDYRGRRSHQQFAVRLTQRLIAVMQQPTADGYVCRVDLNLRPDPGATPVAVGYAAAQTYYRTRGENWERAAMIKARPAAGDLGLGRQFLDEVAPFVWRDSMDFWMLQDMRAMKRRINEHKGSGAIAVAGHNVKLGRGGIREIEFFAQTQQLIYGGADPYLRCERTVEALATLAEAGHIDAEVADDLTEAYEFLRRLEHRLQMVDDQQTQTMPADDAGVARMAAFMAFDEAADFRATLLDTLGRVEARFSRLFDGAAGDVETVWTFSSDPPDPGTLAALGALGFEDPASVHERLRQWEAGALPLGRDARAQLLLCDLLPAIAGAAARQPAPGEALAALQGFLERLPAGLRILSMLSAHPALIALLVEIVSVAPALAVDLRCHSERLQAAVEPAFFAVLPDARLLRAECAAAARRGRDLQGAMDAVGAWAGAIRFQVAANLLRRTVDAHDAGIALCGLCDAVVERTGLLLDGAAAAARTSRPATLAIVAVGSWGSGDLLPCAPVELVFVAGEPGDAAAAARRARRLADLCGSRFPGGRACPIDMVRPLWEAPGPLVTPLEPFAAHLAADATAAQLLAAAEHRVVCGPDGLAAAVGDAVAAAMQAPRSFDLIAGHARERLGALAALLDTGDACAADVRLALDASVRALQARHAAAAPAVLGPRVAAAVAALAEIGAIEAETASLLIEARHRLRDVEAAAALHGTPRGGEDEPLGAAGVAGSAEWRAMLARDVALLGALCDAHLS